jgi:hypothetical protein
MVQHETKYSLGFNFDPELIEGIILANTEYGNNSRITEVYGSLPDCLFPVRQIWTTGSNS